MNSMSTPIRIKRQFDFKLILPCHSGFSSSSRENPAGIWIARALPHTRLYLHQTLQKSKIRMSPSIPRVDNKMRIFNNSHDNPMNNPFKKCPVCSAYKAKGSNLCQPCSNKLSKRASRPRPYQPITLKSDILQNRAKWRTVIGVNPR